MKMFYTLPLLISIFLSIQAQTTPASPAPNVKPPPGTHHVFPPIKPEELEKITAALPTAKAKPTKPRRLLVFYRTEGFVHASIPYCNEALKQIGDKTGAYSADFSDKMEDITTENLARYDGILFNSTTQLHFDDPATRAALLNFAHSGKGVMGIHAATDNFPTWPEGQELLGGRFGGHPWHASDVEAVKVDDPKHQLTQAFGGVGFWINDEIYQVVGPYSRAQVRVLLSLDMSKTQNNRNPKDIKRTDNDFPISWIKNIEGGGRVFYSSFGHNPNMFWTPAILQSYLDGIQFALGDLPADANPSGSLTSDTKAVPAPDPIAPLNGMPPQKKAAPAPQPPAKSAWLLPAFWNQALITTAFAADAPAPTATNSLEAGIAALKKYDYGDDRTEIVALQAYVRTKLTDQDRQFAEKSLLEVLSDASVKTGAKDLTLRALQLVGTDVSIPVLIKFLADKELYSLALTDLLALNTPAAQAALTSSLETVPDFCQPSLIHTIGRTRTVSALPALEKIAVSGSPESSRAALVALGEIGTLESLQSLDRVRTKTTQKESCYWSILNAAHQLLLTAKDAAVSSYITPLLDPACSVPVRLGALGIYVKSDPAQALTSLQNFLKDPNPRLSQDAARLIGNLTEAYWAALAKTATALDPKVQIVLINTAAKTKSPQAAQFLTAALSSTNDDVKIAGILGYGTANIADTGTLLPLLSTPGPLADAAYTSLGELTSPEADSALHTALTSASGAMKAKLINILADRGDTSLIGTALTSTKDSDPAVAEAAFAALSVLVKADDFPKLLALIPDAKTGTMQKNLKTALHRSGSTFTDREAAAKMIIEALKNADETSANYLLSELSQLETPTATAEFQKRLSNPDLEARKSLIRILSSVQAESSSTLLLDAAKNGKEPSERILALRGYLDTLNSLKNMAVPKKLEGYKAAWPLAERQEEKDAIIAALNNLPGGKGKKTAEELKASIPAATSNPAPVPAK